MALAYSWHGIVRSSVCVLEVSQLTWKCIFLFCSYPWWLKIGSSEKGMINNAPPDVLIWNIIIFNTTIFIIWWYQDTLACIVYVLSFFPYGLKILFLLLLTMRDGLLLVRTLSRIFAYSGAVRDNCLLWLFFHCSHSIFPFEVMTLNGLIITKVHPYHMFFSSFDDIDLTNICSCHNSSSALSPGLYFLESNVGETEIAM